MITFLWLILILMFAAWGFWRGAGRQACSIAVLIAMCLLAIPVGWLVQGAVVAIFGLPAVLREPAGVAVGAIIVMGAAEAGVWLLRCKYGEKLTLKKPWDRRVGGLIGAAEGILAGLILGWAFQLLQGPVEALVVMGSENPIVNAAAGAARAVRNSLLGSAARATNPVAEAELIELMPDLGLIAQDEQARKTFLNDPAVRDLLASPPVQRAAARIRQDASLRDAAERGDVRALLNHPALREVLDDEGVRQEILRRSKDIQKSIRKAAEIARRKSAR